MVILLLSSSFFLTGVAVGGLVVELQGRGLGTEEDVSQLMKGVFQTLGGGTTGVAGA